MGKRSKSTQAFLVIAISLFVLALPTYLRWNHLSERELVSFEVSFETPDRENELLAHENELRVFGPTTFTPIFILGTNFFEHHFDLFSQVISLRKNTHVLRC